MLICVSTKDNYYISRSITIGNKYQFSSKFDGEKQWNNKHSYCVYIIDDNGDNKEYPKSCFQTIEDFRENKLNQLDI